MFTKFEILIVILFMANRTPHTTLKLCSSKLTDKTQNLNHSHLTVETILIRGRHTSLKILQLKKVRKPVAISSGVESGPVCACWDA